MGIIYYFHYHPDKSDGKSKEIWRQGPVPFDLDGTGFFSDRIYNARNAASRFYVVTFGYEQSWDYERDADRVTDRYMIHFVFKGICYFNNKKVGAGNIFIVPQNYMHTIRTDKSDPAHYAWVALSGTELENQISIFHLPKEAGIFELPKADEIKNIFLDTIYKKHTETNLEYLLLGEFFKIMSLCNITENLIRTQDPHINSYLSNALNYLNGHYNEEITVSDIAASTHVSVSYLRKIFTAYLGKSPQETIIEKRINVAKTLLESSDLAVKSIANLVGYADQTAFTKIFKKVVGISPQNHRGKKKNAK